MIYSWQLPLCTNRFFSCEIGFLYVNVGSDALGGEQGTSSENRRLFTHNFAQLKA